MTPEQARNAVRRGENSPVYKQSDEYRLATLYLREHPPTQDQWWKIWGKKHAD